MGTPRYMSPEQARGEKVDARTDIFSLGVTLYEMITGRTPFAGETPGEMIAAILRDEPPPLAEFAPETPPELQRLVGKALRKNREERYQGIKDLLLDLKSLKQDLELEERGRTGRTGPAGATSAAQYIIFRIKRHKLGTMLALAVVAGIAFGLYRRFIQFRPSPPPPAIKLDQLTYNGKTFSAAISPDGKYVAYAMWEGGKQSLWLKQTTIVGAGQRVRPPADLSYLWLSFSPDNASLYYLTNDGAGISSVLYQIPVLESAPPRKVIANVWSKVALSPNGQRLAFVRVYPNQGESALMLANVDGSGEQKLATRNYPGGFSEAAGLAWSPNGEIISCGAVSVGAAFRETVIAVRVTDRTQREITSARWYNIENIAWLADGSGMIMQAMNPAAGVQLRLWRLPYPAGDARMLINDLNNYAGISVTASSNMLVTVKIDSSSNIWVAPYGKAVLPKQVTSGTNILEGLNGLSWTRDGKIVYASLESGKFDIWIVDADGGHKQQLTADAGLNLQPSASPDGRYVVFNSDRSGAIELWRMDINGANLKQLTSSGGAYYPSFSPDGRWVVYESLSPGPITLWKVSIDGGAPLQLTSGGKAAYSPAISPNGKQLSYIKLNEQSQPELNIIPFEGGPISKTIDFPSTANPFHVWASDGRAVIYVNHTGRSFYYVNGGVSNVWKQPLDGGSPTQLTDFKSNQIWWLALSHDGKQLAMSRGEERGDVVLISNFR